MHPALWISKTGLDAQQAQLNVIANNLANSNTVGFKRGRAVFEDLLYQNVRQPGGKSSEENELPSGLMMGTGVKTVATEKIFTEGGVVQTNNALDMAINGRGFFQILTPEGTIGYTRAGQFQLNSEGKIVTANGYPLEPAITIPQGSQGITIGSDGTVSVVESGATTATQVGTIELADFQNPAGLEPKGQNLFIATAASGSVQQASAGSNGMGTLLQHSLEGSNVNVIEELVNMIQTQRAYEMNSKVIASVDDMMQFVNQAL